MKFLTPILILLAAVGIFFWYVDPTYRDIQSLQAQANQYQSVLQSANDAATRRDSLINKFNSVSSDDLNHIQKALPDTADPVQLALVIGSYASKYGASIQEVTLPSLFRPATTTSLGAQAANLPSAVSALDPDKNNGSAYEIVPVSFKVDLTYNNFLSFLQDLERNLRIVDISNVAFTANSTGIYDYTFTVNTYWLK